MSKNSPLKPMELLLQSVEAIGSEKTCEVLQKGIGSYKKQDTIVLERITSIVAHELKVSKSDILSRSGNAKQKVTAAIQVLCYVAYINFDFSQSKIAHFLDYHVSNVNKNITRIQKLDKNHPEDIKILEMLQLVEPKITALSKELKNG